MVDLNEAKSTTIKELVELLRAWALIFLRQWKIIVACCVIGALLGFYKAYKTAPQYKAVLSFTLDEKSGANPLSGIAGQLGLNLGSASSGNAFSGDNNIELIKSRRIIEKTLLTPVEIDGKSDLLINRYLGFTHFYESLNNNPELQKELTFKVEQPRESFSRAQDSLLFFLFRTFTRGQIDVSKPDKKLNIFRVQFTSKDELFSKYFTEILIKNVSTFYIETKTQNYRNNVMIITNRLDSVRSALSRDMIGAAILKDQNINIIRSQGGVQSSKKQLNVQVLTTMYSELVKNLEVAQYALLKEQPIIQVIDSPILPLEKNAPGKFKGVILGSFFGLYAGLFCSLLIYIKRHYL